MGWSKMLEKELGEAAKRQWIKEHDTRVRGASYNVMAYLAPALPAPDGHIKKRNSLTFLCSRPRHDISAIMLSQNCGRAQTSIGRNTRNR